MTGAMLDPIADKLLMSAAFISLVELGLAPAWMVTLIVGREFAVTGLRLIALERNVPIAANYWGKAKTTTQIIRRVSDERAVDNLGVASLIDRDPPAKPRDQKSMFRVIAAESTIRNKRMTIPEDEHPASEHLRCAILDQAILDDR